MKTQKCIPAKLRNGSEIIGILDPLVKEWFFNKFTFLKQNYEQQI